MTKYPLFGKDSEPQYTSKFVSIIGTVILWLIFSVCSIFVKGPEKKPKYKTVQIVLSNPAPVEKQQEPVAPPEMAASVPAEPVPEPIVEPVVEPKVETPAPVVEEKPVQKVVETKKTPAKPKTEPQQKQPEPAKPKVVEKPKEPVKPVETVKKAAEPPVLYKSTEELMEEQFNKKSTSKNWEDFFSEDSDSDSVGESVQQERYIEPVKSSFEGSAGTVQKKQQVEETASTQKVQQKASTKTNSTLNDIATQTATANTTVEGVSKATTTDANTDPNSQIKWASGAARKLIMPKKPKLDLSEENQSKLDASVIMISFTVGANGYVTRNSIKTTPPVANSVLSEIADQITEWWFDESNSNDTATLTWTIKRK